MIFLHNSDFLSDKNRFQESSIDLTVTSPPYNLGKEYGKDNTDRLSYDEYLDWSKAWMSRLNRMTSDGGRFCLNIPLDKNLGGSRPIYRDLLNCAISCGWNYHTTIVWNEQNISRRTAWGSWKSASAPYVIAPVEMIAVLFKGDSWKRSSIGRTSTIARDNFISWTNGVWTFSGEKKSRIGHPAPFPIELPRRCIELFSFKEDLIFDPFVGSGTTMVAAASLERNGAAFEVERCYIDIACSRIYGTSGLTATVVL